MEDWAIDDFLQGATNVAARLLISRVADGSMKPVLLIRELQDVRSIACALTDDSHLGRMKDECAQNGFTLSIVLKLPLHGRPTDRI
jgi:hypothetical protein